MNKNVTNMYVRIRDGRKYIVIEYTLTRSARYDNEDLTCSVWCPCKLTSAAISLYFFVQCLLLRPPIERFLMKVINPRHGIVLPFNEAARTSLRPCLFLPNGAKRLTGEAIKNVGIFFIHCFFFRYTVFHFASRHAKWIVRESRWTKERPRNLIV